MTQILENPFELMRVVHELVEHIRKARKSLDFYAGEASPIIFDDPEIAGALEVAAKTARVRMVVGPVIATSRSANSPKLLHLAEKNIIELYFRQTRGRHGHFRILDDEFVYVQSRHDPLLPLDLRESHCEIRRSDNEKEFFSYRILFDSLSIPEKRASRKNFLLVPMERLSMVVDLAKDLGLIYDDLTRDEILGLVKQTSDMLKERRKFVEGREGKALLKRLEAYAVGQE